MHEAEAESLKANQALSRLLLDMWKSSNDDIKRSNVVSSRLRVVAVISSIMAAVCLAVTIYLFSAIRTLDGEIKAVQHILESGVVVEETTTTTEETTVTQDADNGSNVYQGPGAVYNEAGD